MDMRTIIAEYKKVSGAAWAEYRKVNDTAGAEYRKVVGAAYAEYGKVNDTAYAEYTKVSDAALAEYTKARDAAWNAIADKTDDPLASWIVKNCAEHRDEALDVLSVLPASLGELDALAARSGWCGAWDDFRASALADGVIK